MSQQLQSNDNQDNNNDQIINIYSNQPITRKETIAEFEESLLNLNQKLKTKEEIITCPFCKNLSKTVLSKRISCSTVLFCSFGCFLIPSIIQIIRGKDMNMYDVDHFCSTCSNKIYSYKSLC